MKEDLTGPKIWRRTWIFVWLFGLTHTAWPRCIEMCEEVMSKYMHKRIFCQKGVKTAALLSRSTRHFSAAHIFPSKLDFKSLDIIKAQVFFYFTSLYLSLVFARSIKTEPYPRGTFSGSILRFNQMNNAHNLGNVGGRSDPRVKSWIQRIRRNCSTES